MTFAAVMGRILDMFDDGDGDSDVGEIVAVEVVVDVGFVTLV